MKHRERRRGDAASTIMRMLSSLVAALLVVPSAGQWIPPFPPLNEWYFPPAPPMSYFSEMICSNITELTNLQANCGTPTSMTYDMEDDTLCMISALYLARDVGTMLDQLCPTLSVQLAAFMNVTTCAGFSSVMSTTFCDDLMSCMSSLCGSSMTPSPGYSVPPLSHPPGLKVAPPSPPGYTAPPLPPGSCSRHSPQSCTTCEACIGCTANNMGCAGWCGTDDTCSLGSGGGWPFNGACPVDKWFYTSCSMPESSGQFTPPPLPPLPPPDEHQPGANPDASLGAGQAAAGGPPVGAGQIFAMVFCGVMIFFASICVLARRAQRRRIEQLLGEDFTAAVGPAGSARMVAVKSSKRDVELVAAERT